MSSRHQSRRRRTYGRRQHEIRERRVPGSPDAWFGSELDAAIDMPVGARALDAEIESAYGWSEGRR